MITYRNVSSQGRTIIDVYLQGVSDRKPHLVGTIRQDGISWRYTPKGSKIAGEPWPSLQAVKQSLEED